MEVAQHLRGNNVGRPWGFILTQRLRSVVLLTVLTVAIITLGILVFKHLLGNRPAPSRLASGPSLWVGVPVDERRYYLDDLLGQPWKRNYVIPDLTKSKFSGLNKSQVLSLLGPPHSMHASSDYLSYKLGDLGEDKDVLDSVIEAVTPGAVSSMDYLIVSFDPQSGVVSEVRISS